MNTLTLVELAQAIEDKKAIEVFYTKDNRWASADFIAGGDSLRFIIDCLKENRVRIKPEPRQWLINERNGQTTPVDRGPIKKAGYVLVSEVIE